jgi:hypothetical protein
LATADCHIEFPFRIARADPSPAANIPIPSFPATISCHSPLLSKVCADDIKSVTPLVSPSFWAEFSSIDMGMSHVRELSTQTLHLPLEEIHCRVLEIQYDEYNQKLKGIVGPIRYWVDPNSHLIRRVEFRDANPQGARSWTATIEKIRMGGPPPSWLVQTASSSQCKTIGNWKVST